jgi:hypothetical protein
MRCLPRRSVRATRTLAMRLLLLLVCGSLGCSLSSGREEQPENLKNRQVAAHWMEMKRGLVSPLMGAWGWSATASLAKGREDHTATLLPSGKVLVVGGHDWNDPLASAEVYDPATESWSPTSALPTPRTLHTATLLPSGKVLVVGGQHVGVLASAEVYDPSTGAWSPTGALATARRLHTATLLPSGKVLVVGGDASNQLASAEVYDPATGAWSPTGAMATARRHHSATLLPSGKVLVAGGWDLDYAPVASAEVYDPATGVWSPTGALSTDRYFHTATLLPSGKVLVAGGADSSSVLASAEVYDSATGAWSSTGALATARVIHTAMLLPSGKVLAATGANQSSAEVYDPATGAWSPTGALATDRYYHTATLLPSGRVLVVGGFSNSVGILASAEVYHVLTVVEAPANGSTTSDSTPAYSGTAEANSTVTVIVDGVTVGTTIAGAAGDWSLTPAAPLADGTHTVKAFATDANNNTTPDSNTNTFTVDLTNPTVVVISPTEGSTTNDSTPAYSGTVEAGSTVTISVDSVLLGSATVTGNAWTFTPTTPLADGTHTVTATATDAAGNIGTDSNTFTVDLTNPTVVATSPAEGSATNDSTPAYSGTVEVGSTVTISVDSVLLGSATVTGNAWTFTPTTPLADGTHTVTATATDAAGNIGTDSNTFTVDLTNPTVVVISPAEGSTTNDSTPAYSGTAEAGSTVTISVDGVLLGSATVTGNAWTFTPTTQLPDGQHTVIATATDPVGNTGPDSNTFTVDTAATVVVTSPAEGSTTNDSTPAYSGTVEAGSTVTISVDGVPLGNALVMGSVWTFTPTAPLGDGTHSVTPTATDAVGNTASDSNGFTVDTQAPNAPVVSTPANNSTTSDNMPTYTGAAETLSTVTLIVDGAAVGTTTAGTGNNWSFTQPTALADGSHTVNATATDAAGNVSTASLPLTLTVDTTPPSAPEVLTPANGSTTSDTLPGFSGKAEALSTVTLIVDGTQVGTPTADTAGAWSFTSTTALQGGPHTVYARATDAMGHTSPNSSTHTFTVDTDLSKGGWRTTGALSTARGDHTATVLRSGKVLVTGGEGSSGPLASSELYDPGTGGWRSTGALATARTGHTATALSSGKVLVTGGDNPSNGSLASSELYDLDTQVWRSAGALATARTGHTATALPSGKVLVTGGEGSSGALASAELYDPAAQAWSPTSALATARTGHTATVLPSGKVLVTGGEGSSGSLVSAEVYDPATGAWSPTSPLATARAHHTAVLLASGQVLITGGEDASGLLTSTEVYDPATGVWSTQHSLGTARAHLSAVLLPSDRVLITGSAGPGGALSSTEVYTPSTGIWSPTGILEAARHGHTATLLPSGQVLVTGGWDGPDSPLASTELYATLGATRPTPPLDEARTDSMAVVLPNGQVLVAGGSGASGPLASAQLYNPVTEQWINAASLGTARSSSTATLLNTGEVLVSGGTGVGSMHLRALGTGGTVLQSVELFDPKTNIWRLTGSLHEARHSHSALLLSTGHVLVAGGIGKDGTALPSTELYNPATGSWRQTGPMHTPRQRHMVAQLPTGKVLAAGGLDAQGRPLSSAEVFDPGTGEWTEIRSMSTARAASTAAVLHTSQVLVAGGTDGNKALQSAEIYEPHTGEWIPVGALHTARKAHAAQLLPTGRVLIVGGSSDRTVLDDVEVYDPGQRKWEEMTRVITPREDSMTVLLPTGQVLVIAGKNADGSLSNTEVYDEYGAPEPLRPVIHQVASQKRMATFVVQGNSLMAPPGGSQLVRLQTVPEGELKEADATEFSPHSVKVTLPDAPDGVHLLFVLVNDIAGGQVVEVDGTPPGAPSVTGFVTTPQPTLSGTAEPRSTVQVLLNGREAGTVQSKATGDWSVPLPTAPEDGTYTALATATDAAGNVSLPSSPLSFSVDTQAPSAPVVNALGAPTKKPRPTLSGTAERGSIVTVSVDGQETGSASVDTAGLWSFTPSTVLRDGTHTASATATDQAGNKSPSSALLSFIVDTQTPAAPEVLSPQEGDTMDSHTASASGTAEPGSIVTVAVDGEEQGTIQADGMGAWNFSLPTGLEKGEHTLSATATDAAGNVSPPSIRTFTVSGDTSGGCSGCAAGSGEPSLVLLGLAVLKRLLSRRRSPSA